MKAYLLAAAVALLVAAAPQAQALPLGSPTAPDNTPAEPTGKLAYRNPAANALIPVEADKRKPVADDLQATVVKLLERFHGSKQSY